MSNEPSERKVVHERGAMGAKPPKPARRSGVAHVSPGHYEMPAEAATPASHGKRAIRPVKREIGQKGGL